MSVVRGIRGAITVERDEPELILDATGRLLREIVERNGVAAEDVASALFTVTPDLVSEFPAAAARAMGWSLVPLLNFTEIGVPGRLERCIRVMVHINTELRQDEIRHVYLEGATVLRPDLTAQR
ncbi:MAG TPA: chorismate mutase [Candidatus Baltobacteraceae bacterium]|nr:chorismate mutase [Candidatus Baltobacteraceae bacterium]